MQNCSSRSTYRLCHVQSREHEAVVCRIGRRYGQNLRDLPTYSLPLQILEGIQRTEGDRVHSAEDSRKDRHRQDECRLIMRIFFLFISTTFSISFFIFVWSTSFNRIQLAERISEAVSWWRVKIKTDYEMFGNSCKTRRLLGTGFADWVII